MRTLGFAFTSLALVLVACASSGTDAPTGSSGGTGAGTGTSKDGGSGTTKTGGDDASTSSSGGDGNGNDSGINVGTGDDDASSGNGGGDDDASTGTNDAGHATDAGSHTDAGGGSSDGAGTRKACTSTFGSALSGSFGRLDGYIVSVVTTHGSSSCNADSTHVHVQVSMNGSVYDVAINIDGGYWLSTDMALPGDAWSEGWHPSDELNYVTLGVHSSDFTAVAQSALETDVENALASANHITAYGTTYTGSDSGSGIHDIHRESTNKDGAIFLDPTTSNPHALLFRFSSDSF